MNQVVVITAGHVYDNARYTPLYIRGTTRNGLVRIVGGGFTSEPAGDRRRDDTIDLAVIELTTRARHEILNAGVAYAPLCAIDTGILRHGLYGVIGYPEAINETTPELVTANRFVQVVPSEPAFFLTSPATSDTYASIGCKANLNFVGSLDHRRIMDVRLPSGYALHPRGASGGGVFFFGSASEVIAGRPDVSLVGITTHYYEDKQLVVAANARAIRSLLREL
jgi:hypothetical protein